VPTTAKAALPRRPCRWGRTVLTGFLRFPVPHGVVERDERAPARAALAQAADGSVAVAASATTTAFETSLRSVSSAASKPSVARTASAAAEAFGIQFEDGPAGRPRPALRGTIGACAASRSCTSSATRGRGCWPAISRIPSRRAVRESRFSIASRAVCCACASHCSDGSRTRCSHVVHLRPGARRGCPSPCGPGRSACRGRTRTFRRPLRSGGPDCALR